MFVKNDNEFNCINCGKKVEKLKYTSRDHCNSCLHSIHVDIFPGDRSNECQGLLVPINVIQNTKKGLYFIDDYNKDIVFFNGQFKSLSREKGFNSWIRNYISNASQAFT